MIQEQTTLVTLSAERNLAQIKRFAGIPVKAYKDPEAAKAMEASFLLLSECLQELPKEAEGKVLYTTVPVGISHHPHEGQTVVSLGPLTVVSEDLGRLLEDCKEAVLIAATAGLSYDRLIRRYAHLSPAKALWFQAIGADAIEAVLDRFCLELSQEESPLTPRFSPGYGDLPLAFQRDLFRLLEPEQLLGLTLNESLLMTPTKSVTAILGIKGDHHASD